MTHGAWPIAIFLTFAIVLMVLTVVGGEHSERNVRSKERAEREQAELDARADAAAGYRR